MSVLKLTYKRERADVHFYIIADEPSDVNSKEHKTWERLKQNPAVQMIYAKQSELIAEEIEEKTAGKFLSTEQIKLNSF